MKNYTYLVGKTFEQFKQWYNPNKKGSDMITTMHYMKRAEEIDCLDKLVRSTVYNALRTLCSNFDKSKVTIHIQKENDMFTFWGELAN